MHNLHIFRNHTCQLDKVAPLDNGTLVTFVNNGLYAMIEQLNNFACYVESRMITLNRQIDTCYSNLVILEMKLNSINIPNDHALSQGVSNSTPVVTNETEIEPQSGGVSSTVHTPVPPPSHDKVDVKETQSNESEDAPKGEDVPVEEPQEDMSEELQKYRKMLKFGVHESAVRQKMILEGIDPTRLNLCSWNTVYSQSM